MRDLNAYNRFADIVGREDEEINLAEAALLIAAQEYPNLDIKKYLKILDRMAETVKRRVRRGDDPHAVIGKINDHLFNEEGFRGNSEDYYDPKNSFLNQVLSRKTGIPITLSIVYMEMARRVGLPLEGVGFPGHFLVKYVSEEEEIIIDPFNRGEILSAYDCQDRLDNVYKGAVEFQEEFLASVTKKQILTRMLTNLKGIYLRSQAYEKSLDVLEMLLCVDPWAAQEMKDRGLLHYHFKEFGKAVNDFEQYLKLSPDAHDAKEIREHIQLLRRLIAMMN